MLTTVQLNTLHWNMAAEAGLNIVRYKYNSTYKEHIVQ